MVNNKMVNEYQNIKAPKRYTFPQQLLMLAQTPVTDEMTHGEAKQIIAAQKRLQREFAKAALYHIQALTGRNLTDENPQWKYHNVTITGNKLQGTVKVIQYQYDDRAPGQITDKWEFSKNTLLKKYYKEKKNG